MAMIQFRVYGVPAAQGSMRAIVHKHTGRPILIHDKTKDLAAWRAMVAQAARAARPLGEARKTFKDLDDEAKGRITELKIKGAVRIAGFVITVKEIKGRAVAFGTKPSKRIYITPPKEEE